MSDEPLTEGKPPEFQEGMEPTPDPNAPPMPPPNRPVEPFRGGPYTRDGECVPNAAGEAPRVNSAPRVAFDITGHEVGPNVGQLKIGVCDKVGPGGAYHDYGVVHDDALLTRIHFQEGPIGEVGINGVTMEALLVVIGHRLQCFQAGGHRCTENEQALHHVREALGFLHARTVHRMKAGVEGTSNP